MSLYRLDSGIRNGPSQAASLALGLMAHTKRANWTEFTDPKNMEDSAFVLALSEVKLTAEQIAVLDIAASRGQLKFVAPRPLSTLASCSHCGKWAVVGSKTTATNCPLTYNCEGKMTKGSVAKKIEIDENGIDVPKAGKAAPAAEAEGDATPVPATVSTSPHQPPPADDYGDDVWGF